MDNKIITLADIPTDNECYITKIHGHGGFRHRIMEMGFVRGKKVKVQKNAPLLDPIEYVIMGSHVSLRRSEAQNIEVAKFPAESESGYNGTLTETIPAKIEKMGKEITVALVGNPNCGKTSFFNRATGLHEKVGNYSGVTVDSRIGTVRHKGYNIHLADLPGTYSITEFSPEERFVRSFIADKHPDIVLNVIDASNLERNLFLTTQLIDMNLRMAIALNMFDELQKTHADFRHNDLSQMLGIPIVPTVSSKGTGIPEVFDRIISLYEDRSGSQKHIHINYGANIECEIKKVKEAVGNNSPLFDKYHGRYAAIKLIENDSAMISEAKKEKNSEAILQTAKKSRENLEKEYGNDISDIFANEKYGFIRGALKETFGDGSDGKWKLSTAIDVVLTNKWLGFPVLLFFLWLMFQTTFALGAYPQEWIEQGVEWLGVFAGSHLPEGMLNDMIVDGIIGGTGAVLSFLPNILILFLFISVLEDTGYMARAAFIMDKLMHKMGLHGKSFIPFLIGFGCSVPAVMATRTLENRKDRILTAVSVPFFSCSARLPVYLLFVSAFFGKNQGLILLSIYLIGISAAIFTALTLKKTIFRNEDDSFVMELPPYRIPTTRNTLIHMWDKASQYIKKMGTVILFASIIVWALGYFPRHNAEINALDAEIGQLENLPNNDEQIAELKLAKLSAQTENSYIGRLGHFIEPVVRPLGFDWKMGVSILTGLGAKEIVVSSMGILYQADSEADEESTSLITSLQSQTNASGEKTFTPLVAYGFMIFVLLCFPCVAAIAAIARETSWKWAAFSVCHSTALAWIVAFLIHQTGKIF